MDNIPQVEFVNSPRSEEERLKFTRRVIEQGFYQKHGFVVLPTVNTRVDENALVVYPEEMVYRPIEVVTWEREWKRVEIAYWQEMERYFPGVMKLVGEVKVRLTRYGTVASNMESGIKEGRKEVFYLRADVDISHLAAMIINSVLHGERKGLGITWTKREALMDFVMTRPHMRKLFPRFRPVMSQLTRIPAAIRKESEDYLRTLGIGMHQAEYEIRDGRIWIHGTPIGHELSKNEKLILRELVEHQNELVSYDQLADAVWGAGEFKTFWALNKLVERMRPKLTKLGVDGKKIRSVRGQGYLLTR